MAHDVISKLYPELKALFDKVKAESPMASKLTVTEWNGVKSEVSACLIRGFMTGKVKTQEEHDRMFKMAEELAHIEIVLSTKKKWR